MQKWLLKAYLKRQQKMQENSQLCLDCNKISYPTKRLSVFNLGVWILLGVLVSCGFGIYAGFSKTVAIPGFLTTVLFTFINVKRLKPQCRNCFSENLTFDYEVPETKTQEQ